MTEANGFKAYDISHDVAEIYDRIETQTEDIDLLQALIGDRGPMRILEPFCGTGRILIPLAEAGHELVGLDKSTPMLTLAERRLSKLPDAVRESVELIEFDVLADAWPTGFELVILGANCLYELPTAESQRRCIREAAAVLRPGGFLFLDNNHMEGELDPSWREGGVRPGFPTGTCDDGTVVEGTLETVWFDAANRLARFRRTARLTPVDGEAWETEWIEQKHPPSTDEMREWLAEFGFEIVALWGDLERSPYREDAERAVFWARLRRSAGDTLPA